MKKRILLFALVAGFGSLVIASYTAGPGTQGYDCTGADLNSGTGNPTGCSTGSGCHSTAATTGITVLLTIDSTGAVPVTQYVAGKTYTVTITGTNSTSSSLPKFGFQVAATKGATAATVPVNAGTLQSTGLPAGLHYESAPGTSSSFYAGVVEHSTQLSPTSGTGGSGTIYKESFTWTAPVAGTGIVSFFGALNAVNDNGDADAGDLWNTTHITLSEETPTSVANVMNNISITAFPNPAGNSLQLQMNEATEGTYTIQAFTISGQCVTNENIAVSGKTFTAAINTGNWAPGMYSVVVAKDGSSKVIQVVRQ